MKKLLFLLIAFTVSVATALAQEVREFKSLVSTTNSSWQQDTIVNAIVRTQRTNEVAGYWNHIAVQATVTKISGTVGGTVRLVGSVDGINWFRVNPTDSLVATNVATQYKLFTLTTYPYKYLGLQYTGVSGPMSAILKGYALFKRGKQ